MRCSICLILIATQIISVCVATEVKAVTPQVPSTPAKAAEEVSPPKEFVAKSSTEYATHVQQKTTSGTTKSTDPQDDFTKDAERFSYENASRVINAQIKELWKIVEKSTKDCFAVITQEEKLKNALVTAEAQQKSCEDMVKSAEEKKKKVTVSVKEAEEKVQLIKNGNEEVKKKIEMLKSNQTSVKTKKTTAESTNKTILAKLEPIKTLVGKFNKFHECVGHKANHIMFSENITSLVKQVKEENDKIKDDNTQSEMEKISQNCDAILKEIEIEVTKINSTIGELDTLIQKDTESLNAKKTVPETVPPANNKTAVQSTAHGTTPTQSERTVNAPVNTEEKKDSKTATDEIAKPQKATENTTSKETNEQTVPDKSKDSPKMDTNLSNSEEKESTHVSSESQKPKSDSVSYRESSLCLISLLFGMIALSIS